MMRRNYTSQMNIHEAVYCVYEAKRNSEIVPGVGADTRLYVSHFDSGMQRLTISPLHENIALLEKQYATFGPQRFSLDRVPLLQDSMMFCGSAIK